MSAASSAVGGMAIAAVVSRALGFAKATLLVIAIGGTARSVGGQTFGVANDVPTNLYTLLATGVLSAMIFPQIMRAIQRKSTHDLDRLLTLIIVSAFALTAIATLAAPLLVRLYAPEWPPEWTELAVFMAYLCMPQLFFFIVYAALGQLLNAHERYRPFAWAPALSNVIAIGSLLAFLAATGGATGGVSEWAPWMVALLCLGTLAGTVGQTVLVTVALRGVGYRFRPRWGVADVGHLGRTGAWMLGGALTGQLAYVLVSIAATGAASLLNETSRDGASLNSYGLAMLVFLVPHGVFTVSIVTELFTRVSRAVESGDASEVGTSVDRSLRIVGWVSALFTAGFLIFGPTFSDLLWGSPVIGIVLAWLAPGLLPFSQIYLLNRASMALSDPRAVFYTQLTAAVTTGVGAIICGALLPPEAVVIGIAAVTSAAQYLAWVVAFLLLRRKLLADAIPAPRWRNLGVGLLQVVAAAGIGAAGVLVLQLTVGWA